MKKNLIALSLTSSFAFCQESSFKYTMEGFTEYIVTDVENKTANEIYTKVINWVKENYNTPDSVLKSEIENESVRFNGISSGAALVYDGFGGKGFYDIEYTIKVKFP